MKRIHSKAATRTVRDTIVSVHVAKEAARRKAARARRTAK